MARGEREQLQAPMASRRDAARSARTTASTGNSQGERGGAGRRARRGEASASRASPPRSRSRADSARSWPAATRAASGNSAVSARHATAATIDYHLLGSSERVQIAGDVVAPISPRGDRSPPPQRRSPRRWLATCVSPPPRSRPGCADSHGRFQPRLRARPDLGAVGRGGLGRTASTPAVSGSAPWRRIICWRTAAAAARLPRRVARRVARARAQTRSAHPPRRPSRTSAGADDAALLRQRGQRRRARRGRGLAGPADARTARARRRLHRDSASSPADASSRARILVVELREGRSAPPAAAP